MSTSPTKKGVGAGRQPLSPKSSNKKKQVKSTRVKSPRVKSPRVKSPRGKSEPTDTKMELLGGEFGAQKICIGDKVKTTEYGMGVVKFQGITLFSDGIKFGVDLVKPRGKYNGTVKNHTYFRCKPKHGIFLNKSKIYHVKKPSDGVRLEVSDPVTLPDRGRGVIKFIGPTQFAKGIWYGIELDGRKGKNNGSVQKVRYFFCTKPYGVFVREEKLHAILRGDQSIPDYKSPPASPMPNLNAPILESSGFPDISLSSKRSHDSAEPGIEDSPPLDDPIFRRANTEPVPPVMRTLPQTTTIDPNLASFAEAQQTKINKLAIMESDTSDAEPIVTDLSPTGANVCTDDNPSYNNTSNGIPPLMAAVALSTAPILEAANTLSTAVGKGGIMPAKINSNAPSVNNSDNDDSSDSDAPQSKARQKMSAGSKRRSKRGYLSPNTQFSSTTTDAFGGRDRSHTFPTIALATDNSSKIASGTSTKQEFKILLLGNTRAGKTSIIRKFITDSFSAQYRRSVGFQEFEHTCEVPIELLEEVETDQHMLEPILDGSMLGSMQEDVDPFESDEEKSDDGMDMMMGPFSSAIDTLPLPHGANSNEPNHQPVTAPEMQLDLSGKGHHQVGAAKPTTTQKTEITLDITLKIIDIGFHVHNIEDFHNCNALVLVCNAGDSASLDGMLFKYQDFINRTTSRRDYRASSVASTKSKGSDETESPNKFIPVVVAVNKWDLEGRQRELNKHDVLTFIRTRLRPFVDKQLKEMGIEVNRGSKEKKEETKTTDDEENRNSRINTAPIFKTGSERRMANQTLLQAPSLKIYYDDGDSESELSDIDESGDSERRKKRKSRSKKRKSRAARKRKDSGHRPVLPPTIEENEEGIDEDDDDDGTDDDFDEDDAFRDEDIYNVSVIECSASTGLNIARVFEKCIHKALPPKLTAMSHRRTRTTAHVTAPIWLRQIVADFDGLSDDNNSSRENSLSKSAPENYALLDDSGEILEPTYD